MIVDPRSLLPDDNCFWLYNVNQEQIWNDSKVFPPITDIQQLESYSFIFSRFVRFESNSPLSFDDMHKVLQKILNVNDTNNFIIYTYANYTVLEKEKTIYRVFVIFYGNCKNKIDDMMDSLASKVPNYFS